MDAESRALAAELARRAGAPARPVLAPSREHWTPTTVILVAGAITANVMAILGLVINRPPPPPSNAGLAQTRDVDAIETRVQDAQNAAQSARNDLAACRSQFKGFNERLRSLEKGKKRTPAEEPEE